MGAGSSLRVVRVIRVGMAVAIAASAALSLGCVTQATYDGLVYYPHPDTKIGHFHDRSTLEILAPFISGIRYGVEVKLDINPDEITVIDG